ncbi:MAG: peptide chain release factor-like protein, partial [Chloroflexi bacterium]|nr:peptide chain release factor-like protein [Chloroflexota bacterium]
EAFKGTEGGETPYGLDPESIERDSAIQFLRGSGPGGQNRNKVETGVRMTHGPTGISVTATDTKSQSQNRDNALDRLRKKLIEINTPEVPRIATKTPRRVKKQRVEQKRTQGKKKESRQIISLD